MSKIKVKDIEDASNMLNTALDCLYHLEDLNNYRKNKLNKTIEILENINLKEV